MRLEMCKKLNLKVRPLDKDDHCIPTQADGKSPLEIVGQCEFHAGRVMRNFTGQDTLLKPSVQTFYAADPSLNQTELSKNCTIKE